MLRKYAVYVDDNASVMKIAVPAENEEAARKYVEGNGEVIAVKDITQDFPISADYIAKALRNFGFGQIEIDLVVRTLTQTEIAE